MDLEICVKPKNGNFSEKAKSGQLSWLINHHEMVKNQLPDVNNNNKYMKDPIKQRNTHEMMLLQSSNHTQHTYSIHSTRPKRHATQ